MIIYEFLGFRNFNGQLEFRSDQGNTISPEVFTLSNFLWHAQRWREALGFTRSAASAESGLSQWGNFVQLKHLYLSIIEDSGTTPKHGDISTRALAIKDSLTDIDEVGDYWYINHLLRGQAEVESMCIGYTALSIFVHHLCHIVLSVLLAPPKSRQVRAPETIETTIILFKHFRHVERIVAQFERSLANNLSEGERDREYDTIFDLCTNGSLLDASCSLSLVIDIVRKHSAAIRRVICLVYRSFYASNYDIIQPLLENQVKEIFGQNRKAELGWLATEFMKYFGWI
jgi:hypothetical protein